MSALFSARSKEIAVCSANRGNAVPPGKSRSGRDSFARSFPLSNHPENCPHKTEFPARSSRPPSHVRWSLHKPKPPLRVHCLFCSGPSCGHNLFRILAVHLRRRCGHRSHVGRVKSNGVPLTLRNSPVGIEPLSVGVKRSAFSVN